MTALGKLYFISIWIWKICSSVPGILKPLSKQEGPNICWDASFLIPFLNFNQLPAMKKQASQQKVGHSFCVRAPKQWLFRHSFLPIFWQFFDNLTTASFRIGCAFSRFLKKRGVPKDDLSLFYFCEESLIKPTQEKKEKAISCMTDYVIPIKMSF